MPDPEIRPLELSAFRYPDPALAGRRGVVMGYVVRHPDGVLLFDTGFGFGNAELDDVYAPVGRPILEILREAGVEMDEITEIVNCHLHVDHAGQNGAFPGARIHVQSAEWELAHTTDHTVLEWIDAAGATYLLIDGDHQITRAIRVIATPGHTSGHQSLAIDTEAGTVILAGQACYSVGEWVGDPDALEGRSSAPDPLAYDRSIERLRELDPVRVHFSHDRAIWIAEPERPDIGAGGAG